MSSSREQDSKHDRRKRSGETYESITDSAEPTSSIIRLPKATVAQSITKTHPSLPPPLPPKPHVAPAPSTPARSGGVEGPPPLPPKPGFARVPTLELASPPPLPPKPENARGEKLQEKLNPSLHPTRPVPAVPTSDKKPFLEEAVWGQSSLDDKSFADVIYPPEPTILSDGDPKRSSTGIEGQDTSTQSLTERTASGGALPFPSPPFPAHQHCIASLFYRYPAFGDTENDSKQRTVILSKEGAEDAVIGALVLSRVKSKTQLIPVTRPSPIAWRLYRPQKAAGEAWSVLQEYLTNVSLKTHGRNRALQLLTGYVVGACLESTDAGINLLTEIVRRMRGAERSERDGSIFTLLLNIGAHVSFVQRVSWSAVEEVILRVFSDVVEEMHGRQDDDVMWERALRCFLAFCKSSNRRPSDDISSKCLAALSLHLGDMMHTDVDHVLIAEGLCPRLQSTRDENGSAASVDVKCLEEIGGIDTILTLYARTASPSARYRLFAIIYDITVLQCLEELTQEEIAGLRDHIATLRTLLEAHETADLFVHTFRVGPWPEFVMDTIRMLLFYPLTVHSTDVIQGHPRYGQNGLSQQGFREKSENNSASDDHQAKAENRLLQIASSKYVVSTRNLVKMLNKKFCLKVLLQMERMAGQHSGVLAQRETVHFAREWKILSEIEGHVQRFLFSRGSSVREAIADLLTKLYVSVVDITSGRSNVKSILHLSEMIIELFTVKNLRHGGSYRRSEAIESVPQMFLRGKYSVSVDLLGDVNPSIFTLLLLASKRKVPSRRLSESRQCFIEFLGSSRERVEMLRTFVNDNDPVVAYRASEIVSKYSDAASGPSTACTESEKEEEVAEAVLS